MYVWAIAYTPSPIPYCTIAYCLLPIPHPLLPIAYCPSMNATIKIMKEYSEYCQWFAKTLELWDKAIQAHQAK